jgi:outer membrane protein TolC
MTMLLVVTVAGAQQTEIKKGLSFDDAAALMLSNNPAIKQAGYQSAEKMQEAKAARGLYLPTVGLSANYCMMQQDISLDLTPVKDAITPLYSTLSSYGYFSGVPNPDPLTQPQMPVLPDNISTQIVRGKLKEGLSTVENGDWVPVIQKKEFAVISANVAWPLYAGGRIRSANAAAGIEKKEADDAAIQKSGELMSELVERYYGLTLATAVVKVRQEVYNGMEKHLNDALKLEKGGMIPHADVLHARLFFAQAAREFEKAKRQEDITRDALRNTLAMENQDPLFLLNDLFYLDTLEPCSFFRNKAMENSPILAQVASKKQLAAINHSVQRAGFLPEIAAIGTYNLADKDLSVYTPDWILGVGLKWTIFDGAGSYRKMKAASMKCKQADEAEIKVMADINLVINKLYQELTMYKEQLKALETSREFAEEYLRISTKSFNEQMTNETQVVDARLVLAQVNIERLQAMYGYEVNLAKLLQICGMPQRFSNYSKSAASRN